LADDVEYTKTYLSNISAFPFENCLGKIKRMITGRKKSLGTIDQYPSKINSQKWLKIIVYIGKRL